MNIICRTIGHQTETYSTGTYYRHGRQRTGYSIRRSRCRECGYYPPGEPNLVRDIDAWLVGWGRRMRRLWKADCMICGKPRHRRGRAVGDHRQCDEIPF